MNIKTLKRILRNICDDGYAEWVPYFCTPDGESYPINGRIWVDGDGDIYLFSTYGDFPPYTTWDILKRLNKHYPNTYVYFKALIQDHDYYSWDIEDYWYIDTYNDEYYDEEFERLYIDCCEMD